MLNSLIQNQIWWPNFGYQIWFCTRLLNDGAISENCQHAKLSSRDWRLVSWYPIVVTKTWWRHQMESVSALHIRGRSVFVGVRHGHKESLSWQCAWSNQTQIIINIFPYAYRFCTMSVLKFGWRLMEQLRSESVSYQIALFPRLLMTSSVFVGRNVLGTRHHVGPNFVVKWNKIKLESVFYGLVWLFVKIQAILHACQPFPDLHVHMAPLASDSLSTKTLLELGISFSVYAWYLFSGEELNIRNNSCTFKQQQHF